MSPVSVSDDAARAHLNPGSGVGLLLEWHDPATIAARRWVAQQLNYGRSILRIPDVGLD